MVVNHLTFPNVGRQHLHARLICQASNNIIEPPATKAVVLNLNCKSINTKLCKNIQETSAYLVVSQFVRETGTYTFIVKFDH